MEHLFLSNKINWLKLAFYTKTETGPFSCEKSQNLENMFQENYYVKLVL
jgi:hypothetical protein